PYAYGGLEYRGQIHFHTTASDGAETPDAMVTAYRDAGYDFVSIADHDGQPTANPGVEDILFIPGIEESAYRTEKDLWYVHIVGLGATAGQSPTSAAATVGGMLSQGAIPIIAHPNLAPNFYATTAMLERAVGYVGVEIYNGKIPPLEYAVDRWDEVLTKGIKAWGTASDDAHLLTDMNKGWIVVKADSLTTNGIMAAVRRGSFYATQGPDIRHSTTGNTIYVSTSNAASIVFYGRGGMVLSSNASVTAASYEPNGGEIYVRAEVVRASDEKRAWGQPFVIKANPQPLASKSYTVNGRLVAESVEATTGNIVLADDTKAVVAQFFGLNAGTNSPNLANTYSVGVGREAMANSGLHPNGYGYNAALGPSAMNCSTVFASVAVGANAGGGAYGMRNTMIGGGAGHSMRGDTNIALGHYAGSLSIGNANTFIGRQAGRGSLATNAVVIGNGMANAHGTNAIFIDSYPTNMPAGWDATHSAIYRGPNGALNLGRGASIADPSATNRLRGLWAIDNFTSFPGFTDLDTDYGVTLGTMAAEDAGDYLQDASTWSQHAASQAVNCGGFSLTNVLNADVSGVVTARQFVVRQYPRIPYPENPTSEYQWETRLDGTAIVTNWTGYAPGRTNAIPSYYYDEEETEYAVTEIGIGAFSNMTYTAAIQIPDTVTNIMEGAFFKNTWSTNTHIGAGVVSIRTNAFYAHSMVPATAAQKTISVPASVKLIERGAFAHCGALRFDIYGSNVALDNYVFSGAAITNLYWHGTLASTNYIGVFINIAANTVKQYAFAQNGWDSSWTSLFGQPLRVIASTNVHEAIQLAPTNKAAIWWDDVNGRTGVGTDLAFSRNTTNYFIRPDGGTNSISFDESGNMIVAVDGTAALTIRTNGNLGVKSITMEPRAWVDGYRFGV
ncbi:MAG TPA: leucine-rich repeat protein, partial [Candidatus Hydrogenedentes bacterium]|nr:leucine-rich repeat protein [Candidatus Hydrogenedentota bacterium]